MKERKNSCTLFNDFDIKLIDAVPNVLVGINENSEVVIFNKQAEVLFGYKRTEIIGAPLGRIISGNVYEKLLHTGLNGSSSVQQDDSAGEYQAKRENGDEFPVEINLSSLDTSSGKIFINTIRDITEEQNAKLLLQDSANSSNGVLNSLLSQVAVISEDGIVLTANDAWKKFQNKYGETILSRVAVGENCFAHYEEAAKTNDEYTSRVLSGVKSVLDNTSTSFMLEYPCDTVDGRFWFLFRVMPFESHDKKVVVSHQDITRVKESEISLQLATSQVQYIYNTLDISFWGADIVTGKMMYVSPGNEKVYGYTKEEFLNNGNLWYEVVVPEDRDIVNAAYPELNKGNSVVHEHRIRQKNGNIIWVEARMTPTLNEEGKMIRLDGITFDISDRKKAENDLREAKQSYQLVVENINDGLMVDDLEGNVTYANDRFYELFGLTGMEHEKLILEDYVAPEYRKVLRDRHNRRIAGEEVPDIFQYEGVRKDGTRRWFEVRVTRVDENGIAIGTQSAVRDITERKRAEQMLKDQNEELKKVNSELDRFVYSTSHDLRAPLLSMLGLINLCSETTDIEELQEYVKMMKASIYRADETIKDIMDYSRNSRLNVKLEYLDMDVLIHNLVNDIKYMPKAQNILFRVDIKDHRKFYSDRLRISNVINNLLANAVNYSDNKKQKSFINITVASANNARVITIEDNGEGIPADKLDKIFEMFFRNSHKTEGSGLGLFICQEIIAKMGGTIQVTSEEGVGTTFTVTLPDSDTRAD